MGRRKKGPSRFFIKSVVFFAKPSLDNNQCTALFGGHFFLITDPKFVYFCRFSDIIGNGVLFKICKK